MRGNTERLRTLKIKQLRAELDKAKKAILEYEQAEASVCPEDVGVVRYVTALQTQLAKAKDENERLREVIVDDSAYPLLLCLETLTDAADHLLTDHNCDRHGYELIGSASKAAKKHIIRITQVLKGGE